MTPRPRASPNFSFPTVFFRTPKPLTPTPSPSLPPSDFPLCIESTEIWKLGGPSPDAAPNRYVSSRPPLCRTYLLSFRKTHPPFFYPLRCPSIPRASRPCYSQVAPSTPAPVKAHPSGLGLFDSFGGKCLLSNVFLDVFFGPPPGIGCPTVPDFALFLWIFSSPAPFVEIGPEPIRPDLVCFSPEDRNSPRLALRSQCPAGQPVPCAAFASSSPSVTICIVFPFPDVFPFGRNFVEKSTPSLFFSSGCVQAIFGCSPRLAWCTLKAACITFGMELLLPDPPPSPPTGLCHGTVPWTRQSRFVAPQRFAVPDGSRLFLIGPIKPSHNRLRSPPFPVR